MSPRPPPANCLPRRPATLPATVLVTLLGGTIALLFPTVGVADDLTVHRERPMRSSVTLGVHLSRYPDLVVIPGMPVLYDPHLSANYFFYEGSFWVFEEDDWYRSDWYNGPWIRIERDDVPVFLLRIPVRYYNRPPLYFHPWAMEMAPRWSLRWGKHWEKRHRGWDRWDTRRAPPPAPPPEFQQQYPRERYPTSPDMQQRLREQHYRYRPREPRNQPPLQRGAQPPLSPPVAPRQQPQVPPDVQLPPPPPSPMPPTPRQGPGTGQPWERNPRHRESPVAPPPTTGHPPEGDRPSHEGPEPRDDREHRKDGRPRDDRPPGSPKGPGA